MGYLFLAIALGAGIAKGYCGKTLSREMENFRECTYINLMRMFFCTAVGLILALISGGSLAINSGELGIYALAGVSMTVFCVAWMYAYRNEAYMFLSIFTMLGTILTCFLDFIIYKEDILTKEWIGMALLLVAVFIMAIYNKGIKGKLTIRGLLLLIVGSSGAAIADFSQKIYNHEIGRGAEVFNLYMYAIGFVLLAVLFVCLPRQQKPKIKAVFFSKKSTWIYFLMAFFLYLNSVTKTMAGKTLTSAEIYPVLQGANLILSAGMAHFFFKEKMNWKGAVSIVIAFSGLLLMKL